MEIRIPELLARSIGLKKLAPFGVKENEFDWRKFTTINLRRLTPAGMKHLRALIEPHENIRAAKLLLKDLDTWVSAKTDPAGQKVRTVEAFSSLLTEFIRTVPGHRLYRRSTDQAWLAYYVTGVHYVPERRSSDDYHPPYVNMNLAYETVGDQEEKTVGFHMQDIRGKIVGQSLLDMGYVPETTELRESYLVEIERYRPIVKQIGKQYIAGGTATETGDYRPASFDLTVGDRPNKVVIDTDASKGTKVDLEPEFWTLNERQRAKKDLEEAGVAPEDADETFYDATEPDDDETPRDRYGYRGKRDGASEGDLTLDLDPIEVPIHPYLEVFDLGRHTRLSIHVNNLTEYIYDKEIAKKLVLPVHEKDLVKMLVEGRGSGFHDIIGGKSGGVIVLLTGPPGTGKTLTAEVYAESEGKPLYSVQASQLGIAIDKLEEKLRETLDRASEWGAVLLIDEADVYVHSRGNDIIQNAIVGMFLRVLEYHSSIMFLTTNRADLVDDAIASRCVARIDYSYPDLSDQVRIWEVLSKNDGVVLDSKVAQQFAERHPHLSGRDVKNLLKLSKMIADAKGKPIDLEMIEFALRFKPTVADNRIATESSTNVGKTLALAGQPADGGDD